MIVIYTYLKIVITKIGIASWEANFPLYIKSQNPFFKTCVDQPTSYLKLFQF